MWADNHKTSHGGFWSDGGVELKWANNSSTTTTTINSTSISNNAIGPITTALTLSKITVKGWNTDHYANICEATVYFELYKSSTKIATWSDNTSSKSWSSNNCTFTMNSNKDFLALTEGPGDYTIRVYAKITGADTDDYYGEVSYKGCSTTTWWYNNETTNGYYSVTFTIPSKNLTVNGAGNGNTVSGSVNGITKGTAYDIEATPTSGYGFTGWTTTDTHITIADASSPTTTVTFNNYSANATVTANFAVEETHDVAVSYKCGAMTIKTGTTESGVGVTSTRSVTAPAINDHTFSSWTKGSGIVNRSANLTTNPIVINTAVDAAAANCTLTANYTLVTCSLCVGTTATFSAPGTKYLMSYDADVDAYYTIARPINAGKDSLNGHYEMMGIKNNIPFRTFNTGFSVELISAIEQLTGRRVIGNKCCIDNLSIINELGERQQNYGSLIVYTSADSDLQIAAHEDCIPVSTLYKYCEKIRALTLREEWRVGRVIARPFTGTPGNYKLVNSCRRDYSVKPPERSVLDSLIASKYDVIGIGKVNDIFDGQGINKSIKASSNGEAINKLIDIIDKDFTGLCMVNLADFDNLYGHTRDLEGYAKAIEELDVDIPIVLNKLNNDDLLIITADHGNDPTFKGNDHTKENVPVIIYSRNLKEPKRLKYFETLANIGAIIADNFEVEVPKFGHSILEELE